jgi:hypothetical protein
MLKPLLLIVGIGSLTTITDLAAADSDELACTTTPSTVPIDLSSIPTKQVTGQQAVRGVIIDDECDDLPVIGNTAPSKIRSIDPDDDGQLGADDEGDD